MAIQGYIGLAYILVMVIIGIYFSRKASQSMVDFYVAGRSQGTLVVAGTVLATFITGGLVGWFGFLYQLGTKGLLMNAGMAMFWVMVPLLARKLREFEGITTSDFFAERYYSPWMRLLSAMIIIVFLIPVLTGQLVTASRSLGELMSIEASTALIIIALVVGLYTIIGGQYAVAWSDLIQAFVFFIGLILLAVGGVIAVGGVGSLIEQVGALSGPNGEAAGYFLSPEPPGGWSLWGVISLHLVWLTANMSRPELIQRYYIAKDEKSLLKGLGIGAILCMLSYFYLAPLFVGSGLLMAPGVHPDALLPTMAGLLFHPVVQGFILATVTALVMSTSDSQLIAMGGAFSRDIVQKTLFDLGVVKKQYSDKTYITITKVSILVMTVAALILGMLVPGTIYQFVIYGFSTIAAGFFVPLILGYYWPRATREGAFCAMIGGVITNIIANASGYGIFTQIHPILFSIIVAIVLMVVVSLLTPAPPVDVVKRFHPPKGMKVASQEKYSLKN
jgi:sodium/proline symporter